MNRDQYTLCFGCGRDNPHGLHLRPERREDGSWQSAFVAQDFHCGWPGVVHGGVLCAALDEVMSYIVFGEGQAAVTASMNVQFKKSASPGEPLLVRARPERVTRRVVEALGEILRPDGTVIASAEARFLILSESQKKDLGFASLE